MKKQEYIYIALNSSLRYGLLKIGVTANEPEERIKQLSRSTSIPGRFELVRAFKVLDGKMAESRIHLLLREYRYDSGKEFFRISKRDAIAVTERVVSLSVYESSPSLQLHNDFIQHRKFNKQFSANFHRMLFLTMAHSHTNSFFDKLQGFPPDIADGFFGIEAVTKYRPQQTQSAQRILTSFTAFAQDLTVSINKSEPVKVYNDIRYGKGELCWLFSPTMKEQFVNG